RRYESVTCNVQDRDEEAVAEDARRALARLPARPGVDTLLSGEAEERSRARADLALNGGLAGAAILLLLGVGFRHPRQVMLVLLNAPFALVGGVAAARFADHALSLGSLVGFVTLFGITMRNSIMLVSHYDHLVAVEGAAWDRATALRGAGER